MKDRLDDVIFYQLALQLWDKFWDDSEILMKDPRGKEIAKQMTRAVGSISANKVMVVDSEKNIRNFCVFQEVQQEKVKVGISNQSVFYQNKLSMNE